MIYEQLHTNHTHIETVIGDKEVYFSNLTDAAVLQYKIQLVNTTAVRLIDVFNEKLYGSSDTKLQSFIVDWGDGEITRVFTEYINTGVYNTTSNLALTHVYKVPLGSITTISIMAEDESLCPIAVNGNVEDIKIIEMGGTIARPHGTLVTPLHNVIRTNLVKLISLYATTGENLLDRCVDVVSIAGLFKDSPLLSDMSVGLVTQPMNSLKDISELFMNCISLTTLPIDIFKNMSKVDNLARVLSNTRVIRDDGIFKHISATNSMNISGLYSNNPSLVHVEPTSFSGRIVSNASFLFDGCSACIGILESGVLNNISFTNDANLSNMLSNIPSLKITSNSMENIIRPGSNRDLSLLLHNSATNAIVNSEVLAKLTRARKIKSLYSQDIRSTRSDRLSSKAITLSGSNIDISNLMENRNVELSYGVFDTTGVTWPMNTNDCLKGCRSLYNNYRMFGDDSVINSGYEPIVANCSFTIDVKSNATTVYLISPYNLNSNLSVEREAFIKYQVDGAPEVTLNPNNLKTTDGFVTIELNMGSHTITTKSFRCASIYPTYRTSSDTLGYTIKTASIELFPTEICYLGVYGSEIWMAESVNGDFFRLFYDGANVPLSSRPKPNEWASNMFKHFSSYVKRVDIDVFKSFVVNVGHPTVLTDIFSRELSASMYSRRDIWNDLATYRSTNPFKVFNYEHVKTFTQVEELSTWFNDIDARYLVNIDEMSTPHFTKAFVGVKRIGGALGGANITVPVEWNVPNLEYIYNWVGKTTHLNTTLLSAPKLNEVHYFHKNRMTSGMKATDFGDFRMNFSNSKTDDVDISNMFYLEYFEIPDGFISNVRGKLLFNDCFSGSYKMNCSDDTGVFTNIGSKEAGHISKLRCYQIPEPFTINLTGIGPNSTISFTPNDEVLPSIDPIYRMYDAHGVLVESGLTSPNLLRVTTPVTISKIEILSSSHNYTISNSIATGGVESLEGVYGSIKWDEKNLISSYPGLVGASKVNSPLWRNIEPVNGVINFTGLFENSTDKEVLNQDIFSLKLQNLTTLLMVNMFKGSSINRFKLEIFEQFGIAGLDCTGMFRGITDNTFQWVSDAQGYHFMEILFTRITSSRSMFEFSALPSSIFQNAPEFCIKRDGTRIPLVEQTVTDMASMFNMYQYSGPNANQLTTESLPLWSTDSSTKLTDISNMFLKANYLVSVSPDNFILPKSTTSFNAFNYNSRISEKIIVLNPDSKFNIGSANDVGWLYNIVKPRFTMEYDTYHMLTCDGRDGDLSLSGFLPGARPNKPHSPADILVEPMDDTFKTKKITSINSLFARFFSYAPPNILFRNIGSITEDAGVPGYSLLEYPNFILYTGINITEGTTHITLQREELSPASKSTIYLTYTILYSHDDIGEKTWIVVDKGTDTVNIPVDSSKLINGTFDLKIQSTQNFVILDNGVSSIDRLSGEFRKDLQPGDSKFFNFRARNFYLIKNLDSTLFKQVKILENNDEFMFSYQRKSELVSLEGQIFSNQTHMRDISSLFEYCPKFKPKPENMVGFSGVTSANALFRYCTIDDTNLLENLPNVKELMWVFTGCTIKKLNVATFRGLSALTELMSAFADTTLPDNTQITSEFFSNISTTVTSMSRMFMNASGLSSTTVAPIGVGAITIRPGVNYQAMFSTTNIQDVTLDMFTNTTIVDDVQNLNSMFQACYTYHSKTVIESVLGNMTGLIFVPSSEITFKINGFKNTTKFINLSGHIANLNPTMKVILHGTPSTTTYLTIDELVSKGVAMTGDTITLVGSNAVFPSEVNVVEIGGSFPGPTVDNSLLRLGVLCPSVSKIDSKLLDNLTDQTNLDYLFEGLDNFNVIPRNIFSKTTKLKSLVGVFKNIKNGTNCVLNVLFDQLTEIENLSQAFMNTSIGHAIDGSIKIVSQKVVNCTSMFENSSMMVSRDAINFTNSIDATDMFKSCFSMYPEERIMQTCTFTPGTTGIEFKEPLRLKLNITEPNTEVKLNSLLSNGSGINDPTYSNDIMADFGNGETVVLRSMLKSNIHMYGTTYKTPGIYDALVWCNTHAISIVLKSDNFMSRVVEEIDGKFQLRIDKRSRFLISAFPNLKKIGNRIFDNLLPDVMVGQSEIFFQVCLSSPIPDGILPPCIVDGTSLNIESLFSWSSSEFEDVFSRLDVSGVKTIKLGDIMSWYNNKKTPDYRIFSKFRNIDTIGFVRAFKAIKGPATLFDDFMIPVVRELGPKITDFTDSMSHTVGQAFGTNFTNIRESLKNKNIISTNNMMRSITPIYEYGKSVFDSMAFAENSNIDMSETFWSINVVHGVIRFRVINGLVPGSRFNVSKIFGNTASSILTMNQIMGGNEFYGDYVLDQIPIVKTTLVVTRGTLVLKAFISGYIANDWYIAVNGEIIHFEVWYPSTHSVEVNDGDIVEIVTTKNAYHTFVRDESSTSKIVSIDGELDINPSLIINGRLSRTLTDMYGSSLEHVGGSILNTVSKLITDTSGLLKGSSIREIPTDMFKNLPNLVTAESMFENCTNLNLSASDSNIFIKCSSLRNLNFMFKNTGVTQIPPAFFKGLISTNKTFVGTFMNTRLTSIPADIAEY